MAPSIIFEALGYATTPTTIQHLFSAGGPGVFVGQLKLGEMAASDELLIEWYVSTDDVETAWHRVWSDTVVASGTDAERGYSTPPIPTGFIARLSITQTVGTTFDLDWLILSI